MVPKKSVTGDFFEPTPECPSIEELAGLSASIGNSGQSEQALRHVAACPRCQAELVLLASFEQAEANSGEEEEDLRWMLDRLPQRSNLETARGSTPVLGSWRSWWNRLGLFRPVPVLAAIAALVILGIGIREFMAPAPQLRLPTGESVTMRGYQIRLLTPLIDIAAVPDELTWEPVVGAARYEVVVRYVDGTEAVRFNSGGNHAKWPESMRALATPGRSLFIEVAALDGSGRTLAKSERQPFKLNGN